MVTKTLAAPPPPVFVFVITVSSFHDLIMSLITSHNIVTMVKSSSSQLRSTSTCSASVFAAISQRPRHMYQAEAFARGSPRPVAPWVKTIRHILPLCPPCPPRQVCAPSPLPPLPWVPVMWASVWVPILSPSFRCDACAWSRVSALPGRR